MSYLPKNSTTSPSYLSGLPVTQASNYSSTPSYVSQSNQNSYLPQINQNTSVYPEVENNQTTEDDGHVDAAQYKWELNIQSGTDLAPKDINGKSDPYVVFQFITAKKVGENWTNIKTTRKFETKTPVINETLNPEWNCCIISVNAEIAWRDYAGIKLTCWDKDTIGRDEFMGEAFLYFDEDIPGPTTLTKEIKVNLNSRVKKKDKVSGFITILSTFTNSKRTSERRKSTQIVTCQESKRIGLNRSELVHINATGKREVTVKSSKGDKYTSFCELPKFNTNTDIQSKAERCYGFNTNYALWLVTSCVLAYKQENIVRTVCCNVWDMKDFVFLDDKKTDTQGFCMHNEDILVICFRGTESLQDWITNFKFIQVRPSFPDRYVNAGVRVHQGFNIAVKSVWETIQNFITKAFRAYPDLKLYVCGHSLGGALANLCFGYLVLSDNPVEVTGVYTIGQPRVGNRKFREQLELASEHTKFMRITNNQDCVPFLAGGYHCGTHIHFDSEGRISYEPPIWQKALHSLKSIHGSFSKMQYAGIDDHFSPVYKKLIDIHWAKEQLASISNGDDAFNLCEHIQFLMDMLQEQIKGVLRYKIQFRAIVEHIIYTKPLIITAEDFIVNGIEEISRSRLNSCLVTFSELLVELKEIVLINHYKQTVWLSEASCLKEFTASMNNLATKFQDCVNQIHKILSCPKFSSQPKPSYALLYGEPKTPVYDSKAYELIKFTDIDFENLSEETENDDIYVSKHITIAESMIEEGEINGAIILLTEVENGSVESIGALDSRDKARISYLKATAHAKLHHHKEAIQALSKLSESGEMNNNAIANPVFQSLKNSAEFNAIQSSWNMNSNTPNYSSSPNTLNLLHCDINKLEELFDSADDNGDNFLTTAELNVLIQKMGGLEYILDNLGWIEIPHPTESFIEHEKIMKEKFEIFSGIMSEISVTYRDAVNLEQFITLMARLV